MQAIQNAWLRSRAFGYVGDTKCRNGKESSFLATRLVLNAGKSRIKALGETFRAQNNARENIVREKHPWRKTLLDTIFSMLSVLPGSVPTKKRVCRHRNVSPPKSVPNVFNRDVFRPESVLRQEVSRPGSVWQGCVQIRSKHCSIEPAYPKESQEARDDHRYHFQIACPS